MSLMIVRCIEAEANLGYSGKWHSYLFSAGMKNQWLCLRLPYLRVLSLSLSLCLSFSLSACLSHSGPCMACRNHGKELLGYICSDTRAVYVRFHHCNQWVRIPFGPTWRVLPQASVANTVYLTISLFVPGQDTLMSAVILTCPRLPRLRLPNHSNARCLEKEEKPFLELAVGTMAPSSPVSFLSQIIRSWFRTYILSRLNQLRQPPQPPTRMHNRSSRMNICSMIW